MGDLKTPFEKPIYPNTSNLSGDSITQSGSDPNADGGGGDAALDPFWSNPVTPVPSGEASANSVSGLPALPNRFAPADGPPEIPDLTDRRPGTVDKR